MSHTITHDQHQASRDLENVVNRVTRHCKIGKVTRKVTIPKLTTGGWIWRPNPNDSRWWMNKGPQFGCSCLPGQACGNVACPHRMTATCSTAQLM